MDICKTVTSIAENDRFDDFFKFAYHIRKLDAINNDHDKYSRKILSRLQNRQTILDIVFSNYWCTQDNKMKIKPNSYFSFQIGNSYIMQYQEQAEESAFQLFNRKQLKKGCSNNL